VPAYPGGEKETRVAATALHRLVSAIFAGCGMGGEDADLVADTLVTADLQGVHSHGTYRVPDYVQRLTTGGVDPRGRPRLAVDGGAVLVVDGGNSMGQVSTSFAMRSAIERARSTGVAVAAIGGSNHCGAMAYYTRLAAGEGMVGIATTDALPTMAPWGGRDRIVGINPLSIAIPGGEEGPLVIDTSFGAAAHGKIRVYAQKGIPIPGDWALDVDGNPTIDPVEAARGLIQPVGGHKGVGLAMALGMMSSLLSGAAYGTELGSLEDGARAGRDGHLVMAVRVGAFADPAEFGRRADAAVRQVHDSRPRQGVDRLLVPGELEAECERAFRAGGIPLNDETLDGLRTAALDRGVDPFLVGSVTPG
jgi:LDH2 family malate/lactate/ureidoglycolate dehydrogenase